MSLEPGQKLAHYEIEGLLGKGGMGEVYVARDMKLDRKVALKILPAETASRERRRRFEREAKTVAALNHPNIVHVYSVEEEESIHFITMELVSGQTLGELIPKRGMDLRKLIDVAIPLTNAVADAHKQGVIHRDLKPDNVMVTAEGRVKILDFGLALLRQQPGPSLEGSEAPTGTQVGAVVGTVNYMSPEQAEGKPLDHRTDVFSLGVVLYEMATGRKPFSGETPASAISSILKDTPSEVTELNAELPSDFARTIRRCLAKDPTRRYQSALDVRNDLQELKDLGPTAERSRGTSPRSWRMALVLGAAVVAATLATYLVVSSWRGAEPAATDPGRKFTQLTSLPGAEYSPSIAPDGNSFVYESFEAGNWDIYLRRVEGERAINLTEDSTADDRQPVYSPDGQRIAFRSERDGGGIFVMGATGESVRRVSDRGFNPAWSPSGEEIVFGTTQISQPNNRTSIGQLWITEVASGDERLLRTGDAVHPHWSPNGNRIAYWGIREGAIRDIWTVSVDGGSPIQVTRDDYVDWNPVWSPEGSYLYFSSDRGGNMNLWRVAIDEHTGSVEAEPEAITTGVGSWAWYLSISRDGRRILYAAALDTTNVMKAVLSEDGSVVDGSTEAVTEGSVFFAAPEASHDGSTSRSTLESRPRTCTSLQSGRVSTPTANERHRKGQRAPLVPRRQPHRFLLRSRWYERDLDHQSGRQWAASVDTRQRGTLRHVPHMVSGRNAVSLLHQPNRFVLHGSQPTLGRAIPRSTVSVRQSWDVHRVGLVAGRHEDRRLYRSSQWRCGRHRRIFRRSRNIRGTDEFRFRTHVDG